MRGNSKNSDLSNSYSSMLSDFSNNNNPFISNKIKTKESSSLEDNLNNYLDDLKSNIHKNSQVWKEEEKMKKMINAQTKDKERILASNPLIEERIIQNSLDKMLEFNELSNFPEYREFQDTISYYRSKSNKILFLFFSYLIFACFNRVEAFSMTKYKNMADLINNKKIIKNYIPLKYHFLILTFLSSWLFYINYKIGKEENSFRTVFIKKYGKEKKINFEDVLNSIKINKLV
jgi:hypothetical protein